MRCFMMIGLLLIAVGCGGNTSGTVAEDDELAAYLAENPSPEVAEPGDETVEAE